jgi:hydrogenase maturation protease
MTTAAPVLVIAVGNPSRGDDALGPAFAEAVERAFDDDVRGGLLEVLTDFQLNVEHALDLVGRREVLFVDASLDAARPFTLTPVEPKADRTFSSHSLSPAAVLEAFACVARPPAPRCTLLAIRGDAFELGAGLGDAAQAHLDAALAAFSGWLDERRAREVGLNRRPIGGKSRPCPSLDG